MLLLSLQQAAAELGVGEDAMRKQVLDGTVPAFKLAGRWKIRRSDITPGAWRRPDIMPVVSPTEGTADKPEVVHSRVLKRMTVRLSDLPLENFILRDYLFEQCSMIGPAVLVPLEGVELTGSTFDAPSMDALIWRMADDRQPIVGAIGLVRVAFRDCQFQAVGLGVPDAQYEDVARGLSGA